MKGTTSRLLAFTSTCDIQGKLEEHANVHIEANAWTTHIRHLGILWKNLVNACHGSPCPLFNTLTPQEDKRGTKSSRDLGFNSDVPRYSGGHKWGLLSSIEWRVGDRGGL